MALGGPRRNSDVVHVYFYEFDQEKSDLGSFVHFRMKVEVTFFIFLKTITKGWTIRGE
jgi:hypothetical protein